MGSSSPTTPTTHLFLPSSDRSPLRKGDTVREPPCVRGPSVDLKSLTVVLLCFIYVPGPTVDLVGPRRTSRRSRHGGRDRRGRGTPGVGCGRSLHNFDPGVSVEAPDLPRDYSQYPSLLAQPESLRRPTTSFRDLNSPGPVPSPTFQRPYGEGDPTVSPLLASQLTSAPDLW